MYINSSQIFEDFLLKKLEITISIDSIVSTAGVESKGVNVSNLVEKTGSILQEQSKIFRDIIQAKQMQYKYIFIGLASLLLLDYNLRANVKMNCR